MINVRSFHFERILLLFAVLFFIVGCVPEKKLGSEFLSKRQNITLVIRAPEWVKMVNQSYDTLKDISDLSQREVDSLKYYNSKILQKVKDSIVINNYISNLKLSLDNQGYKTLVASNTDTVFAVKGEAFLINIGQIELDEKKLPIRDETRYNRKMWGADYDQSKVELDYWIDIYKIDNGLAVLPSKLLYDSYELADDDQGYFQWDEKTSTMNYIMQQDEVTPEDIYSLATLMGTDHGERLNEYFLNEYIAYLLPNKTDRILVGVNKKFGTLNRIFDPPFTEIHE